MRLEPFQLERYFGQYEFAVPYPLAASDCDGLELHELLELADARDPRSLAGAAARLHRDAGPPAAARGDLRPLRGLHARPGAGGRAGGAHLPGRQLPGAQRRPRHHDVPRLPVVVLDRRVAARRGGALGTRRAGRLALRSRTPRGTRAAEHAADRGELPPQPDGCPAASRRLRAHRRDRPQPRHPAAVRRDVPAARARPRRPPAVGESSSTMERSRCRGPPRPSAWRGCGSAGSWCATSAS